MLFDLIKFILSKMTVMKAVVYSFYCRLLVVVVVVAVVIVVVYYTNQVNKINKQTKSIW